MYAGVRRRPDYKLSRRKQGFESLGSANKIKHFLI